MTVEGIFRTLFPHAFSSMLNRIENTFKDALAEDIKKNKQSWQSKGYNDGLQQGMEKGRKEGWEKGYETAKVEYTKPGRTYVSFGEELMFPMDFTDYNSDDEREAIASIIRTREWQQFFKHNIMCQAMKKWRDARTQQDPQMMALFNIVGNQFVELVEFYENAPNIQQDTPPKPNFNSLLEDE